MLIYGIHAVLEALRAGRVMELRVSARARGRIGEVLHQAAISHVAVRRVEPAELDRLSSGGVHQGVVAEVDEHRSVAVAELVRESDGVRLIVVLDGIEAPN